MDTKKYLNQIERLEKQIQNKLSEIYQLKTMICSVSVSYENDRVQTSPRNDRIGNTVAKIIDLEKETDALVDEFVSKRNHIIEQIDGIENVDYYHILSLRYVSRNTFDDIANKTGWSIRQTFRIHGQALLEFEREYGAEYKGL